MIDSFIKKYFKPDYLHPDNTKPNLDSRLKRFPFTLSILISYLTYLSAILASRSDQESVIFSLLVFFITLFQATLWILFRRFLAFSGAKENLILPLVIVQFLFSVIHFLDLVTKENGEIKVFIVIFDLLVLFTYYFLLIKTGLNFLQLIMDWLEGFKTLGAALILLPVLQIIFIIYGILRIGEDNQANLAWVSKAILLLELIPIILIQNIFQNAKKNNYILDVK